MMEISQVDPLSESFASDLWNNLRALRERPVGKTELHGGLWFLTRYHEVLEAARDWDTYSSEQGAGLVLAKPDGVKLRPMEVDPPWHRDYRRLIDRHFGPKQVALAEDLVRDNAVKLIERFDERSCDFVRDFAVPFPAANLFPFAFGSDVAVAADLMEWIDHIMTSPSEAADSFGKLFNWAGTMLDGRASRPRGDAFVDSLLDGEVGGRCLTTAERQMVVLNLILGGVETTTHVLSNVVYHLATKPEVRAKLDGDRSLIPAAIEEFLRFETPAPALGRQSTRSSEVRGTTIPADERVVLYFGAANRDPDVYENPDELVLERFAGKAPPHLTFGAGPHRCPGAHLARLEVRVAVEEVLDRLPGLGLATERVEYRKGLARGIRSLPLSFSAR